MTIVMEGLKQTRTVAEICREHQNGQTVYYRWRDKFLEVGKKGLINRGCDENGYKTEFEMFKKSIVRQPHY